MAFFDVALKGFKSAIPILKKDGYTLDEIKQGFTMSKKVIDKINVSDEKKQAFYKAMEESLKNAK